jgi:hypothetical protein
MKAREFAKRAVIYGLGLSIYAYELFIATIEGLGLNARGFWGETRDPVKPHDPIQPEAHVAPDTYADDRASMYQRAIRDFDRYNKMTSAERAAKTHSNPPPSQKEAKS